MPVHRALSKITTDKNEYYLLTRFKDDGSVGISMVDGEMAWHGKISADQFETMADNLKMNHAEFIAQTRKALTRENVGTLNIEYDVKKYGDDIKFGWKKCMPRDKIKIQLGSVDLECHDNSTLVYKAIMNHSIEAGGQFDEKLTALQSDNERLMAERASALKRLEKYVTIKEDLETDLYSKFVTIVNEKKAKIRALKAELDEARNSVPSSSTSHSRKETSRRRASVSPSEDDQSDSKMAASDSEYETDEEENKAPVSKKIKTEVSDTVDELLDDMMEDEEEPKPKPASRRGRVRGRSSRQMPAKPVLPKGSSKESPQPSRSSGRRVSMKKSTSSETSNRSADNLDDLVSQI